ncbi:hypothetical protein [Citromicrobium sp. WPS32]|uniref:hypothetical protein n=1 Tax=Citromicrobium sp. WPS32 TaxID=1634517 RepID=UPI0012E2EA69|nr:hypothetical protein [Citromicrobium sp. WPS32]
MSDTDRFAKTVLFDPAVSGRWQEGREMRESLGIPLVPKFRWHITTLRLVMQQKGPFF